MMGKMTWKRAVLAAVATLFVTAAMANSDTVSYQGILRDAALNPVANGGYPMEFSIYGTDSGGSPLWGPEEYASVAVTNGMFSVYLGSIEPLGSLFADHAMLWLEISADTGAGMETYAPRVPLASVPYAQHALHAATAGSAHSATNADNAGALDGRTASTFADAAHEHSGGDITSGTVPIARLPVGATSSHVAPGDHSHTLNSLSDVSAASPGTGQTLTWSGSSWQPAGGYALIRDVKPANTNGGASISGWQPRDLNVLDTNIPGLTQSGSSFTLPTGRYRIMISAPSFQAGRHKAALFNVTTNANQIIGTSAYSNASTDSADSRSYIEGYLNLAGNTVFEVRHYTPTARGTYGLGLASTGSGTPEVYTVVHVVKY